MDLCDDIIISILALCLTVTPVTKQAAFVLCIASVCRSLRRVLQLQSHLLLRTVPFNVGVRFHYFEAHAPCFAKVLYLGCQNLGAGAYYK